MNVKILLTSLLTLTSAIVYADVESDSERKAGNRLSAYNPMETKGMHKVSLDKDNPLIIAQTGEAKVEVVVHKEASPVVKYAAEELCRRLNQATGANIRIVSEQTGSLPAIILGDNKWIRALGVDVDRLPRDAFVIKRIADTIVIAGKDDPHADPNKVLKTGYMKSLYQRGTLFGVYDFLERFVGVRYYFPGETGTVVPKCETLEVPGMDIVESPDFIQRKWSWDSTAGFKEGGSLKRGSHERTQLGNLEAYQLRAQTMLIPNCHGLSRIGLVERYAKSNPEYFSLLKNGSRDNDLSLPGHHGHLCYMNEGLKEAVFQDAAAYLTEKTAQTRNIKDKRGHYAWSGAACQPGFFNIMPQDGLGPSKYCQCDLCKPYTNNNKYSETIWRFVADIARKLKQNRIPGYVTSMAYSTYKTVPDIDLPDNVLIMLAIPGPWLEQHPNEQQVYDQYIQDWNRKIAPSKVWLWNYANKYGRRDIEGLPNSTPRAVGSYYKRNGKFISGAFMQSDSDQFLFNYLNWYVFAKVSWNIKTDVDKLLKEHHEKMFGAGAKPMGRFFDIIEDLWLNKCLGKAIETPRGPENLPPADNVIWENIYSDSMMAKLDDLFKQAKKLADSEPDSLKRINFIEKHLFGPVKAARKSYFTRKNEIDDLSVEVIRIQSDQVGKDGMPTTQAWKTAVSVNLIPWNTNDKTLVKTIVKGLWDDDYLFLMFDCEEPMVDKMAFSKRERDDKTIWNDASVEVFLNPSGDRKNYYQFLINPAGILTDLKITTTNQKHFDPAWNGDIDVRTTIGKNGWVALLKIPFKDLTGKPVKPGTNFVANFCRSRNLSEVKRSENQLYTWSPYINLNFHQVEKFGSIKFVEKKSDDHASLIKNGDFSKMKNGFPEGWHPPKDDMRRHVMLDEGNFRKGGRSLKIENAPEKICVAQYLPNLKANTTYSLTFFVKTKNIVSVDVKNKGLRGACVTIRTSKRQLDIFPKNGYRGDIPWTKQGFSFKTGSEVMPKSYMRLQLSQANGSVWFDDIRLKQIDE